MKMLRTRKVGIAVLLLSLLGVFAWAGETSWGSLHTTVPTAGTMTLVVAQPREYVATYAWTNAMIVALDPTGARLQADLPAATIPAKTWIRRAVLEVTSAASGVDTLTIGCGEAGDGGAKMFGGISVTALSNCETDAATFCHGEWWDGSEGYLGKYTVSGFGLVCTFIATDATGDTLHDVTGSAGKIHLFLATLP